MQIIREKPCQRRHHRVTAPLAVTIGGARCQGIDWSLGGLRISEFAGTCPAIGDRVELVIEVPFQGFAISFETAAVVVRQTDEDGGLALAFQDLPERARSLMEHFIEDLVRGKMASVEDAICRIDVPVTPISTKPDPNPLTQVPGRRWPLKTIFMSFFYLALGLAVFSYVGVLVYANIIRLEIDTAVISKPIETVKMPIDGLVSTVFAIPGSRVQAGQPLIAVENRALEADIDQAEIALSAANTALDRARERLAIEQDRLEDYRLVNATELGEASADLNAKRAALDVANRHFKRIEKLHRKGHATERDLDLARGEVTLAQAAMDAAQELHKRSAALAAASETRHHNGREFIVDLDLLRVEIQENEALRDQASARLVALLKQRERLFVRAPFDGTFVQQLHPAGAQLARGDLLAVVEEDVEPVIEAFVNQEEVLEIGLGDEATIFFPALNRRVEGRIVSVDRTTGFIDEQRSQYTWRGPDDRSARVVLELPRQAAEDVALTAGLPAVVIFNRRTTREIVSRFGKLLSVGEETEPATGRAI